jgi:dTMP kinase
MNRGKYIVLEGPEGVGKTTQLAELGRRLQAAGLPVRMLREPDSQSDLTARAIRQLTQDPRYPMNTRAEVLLYNAARAQSLQVIKQSVDQGLICLVDRNYLTTLAIQYYGRGDVPDYNTINTIISFAVGDVEPDLTVVLDAPTALLRDRVKNRSQGERFDNLDEAFLERVRAGYLWEARQRILPVVFATEGAEAVADKIWSLVSTCLADRSGTPTMSSVADIINQTSAPAYEPPIGKAQIAVGEVTQQAIELADIIPNADQPLLIKNGDALSITPAGKAYLEQAVTSVNGNIYAFTNKLSQITVAAAMARLSRRGDDMRITILDEFAGKADKDEKLLQRVITAYGDDSVQQLAGIHFVIENTTKLMTNKLEWGRLAAYLEQSTRYIYFDKKTTEGKYRYYVPNGLRPKIEQTYIQNMDRIFDLYSSMVHRLTDYIRQKSSVPKAEQDGAWQGATRAQACDVVRLVLPTATTTTVGVYASGQALESLIMHLMSDELAEARDIGVDLLRQARQIIPVLLERADKPDRGGATVAYRAETFKKMDLVTAALVTSNYAKNNASAVTLSDYWPKNELSIVPDMLYEHSDLSLADLQRESTNFSYEQRQKVFSTYVGERLNRRHRPGRAFEKIHYSWDLLCDFGIFCDLMRHRMVDDLEWQAQTPRYGYDTPDLIVEAGLIDQFDECFDISLRLYSLLQESGYTLEAQYATLLGHKMRWKVTYNAREAFHLHELRTSPQGHPGYRKLVNEMHQKVAEVHPLTAAAMKFVNQGEDKELTRLAAERYAQFKLKQFDS